MSKEEVTNKGLDDDVSGSLKLLDKDGKSHDIDRKNAFISTLIKTGLDTGNDLYTFVHCLST